MQEETPQEAVVKPTAAGMYSYLLNPARGAYTEVDKATAEQLRASVPEVPDLANNNRIFVRRTARWFVGHGIDQVIDIGCGMPTDSNTHEVAQNLQPGTHVVYVDKDPMIAQRANELLADNPDVAFIDHDLTDPDAILADPALQALIDFDRPVGLMLALVLHLVPEQHDTHALVQRYLEPLPSGSYLALSAPTYEGIDPERIKVVKQVLSGAESVTFRSHAEIKRYFDGLEMVQPYEGADTDDLVWSNQWGAKEPQRADRSGMWILAGIARKP